ncbi:MAG: hypothetical protein HKO04_03625 [Silicimonas sp.]|nr:hypothetical protein [Silicimonas sp.]
MIRVVGLIILLVLPLAVAAQTGDLSEKRLAELRVIADRIALIETGDVPDMLVNAVFAANGTRGERPLADQVAGMNLGAMRTLERKAAVIALAAFLRERISERAIAEVYAATVYYGRNCYGYVDAVRWLARRTPDRAGDNVWLALAALPRSPSLYLRDRSALKARVAVIVTEMEAQNLVGSDAAERLRGLPLANIDSGKGCSGR